MTSWERLIKVESPHPNRAHHMMLRQDTGHLEKHQVVDPIFHVLSIHATCLAFTMSQIRIRLSSNSTTRQQSAISMNASSVLQIRLYVLVFSDPYSCPIDELNIIMTVANVRPSGEKVMCSLPRWKMCEIVKPLISFHISDFYRITVGWTANNLLFGEIAIWRQFRSSVYRNPPGSSIPKIHWIILVFRTGISSKKQLAVRREGNSRKCSWCPVEYSHRHPIWPQP